jgi:hypothetical protein
MTTTPKKNAAAQALGALGGRANTEAQNAARAQNAKLAGRPRRICIYCRQSVKAGHRDPRQDVTCGAHGWRWLGPRQDAGRPVRPDPQLLADVLVALTPPGVPPGVQRAIIARVKRALAASTAGSPITAPRRAGSGPLRGSRRQPAPTLATTPPDRAERPRSRRHG